MKKSLLIITSCVFAGMSFGQLTQANEPAIGATSSMFLCDSNLTNYAAITGTGVTWDYSTMGIYLGQTRNISVLDATATIETADYPNCTKAFSIQDLLTSFYYSDATSRTSEGFVYIDAGTPYNVKFNTDPAIMMTYPFAQGNSNSDAYVGTVNAGFDLDVTGTVNSTVDGTGTILLPNGITVSNVLRLKTADIATIITPLGNGEILREQFEYYDLATGNLPIFIHTKIDLTLPGAPAQTSQLVLSKFGSSVIVGLNEGEISNLSIYPNPATDEFVVKGNFTTGKVTVYSAQGQEVVSQEISNGQSIQVSELTKGLYIVKVEANGSTSMKNLSIK